MEKVNTLKNNLKKMAPRPFGEKFGEWLVLNFEKELKPRTDLSHDAVLNGGRCEIKISRAMIKSSSKLSFEKKLLIENTSDFVSSYDSHDFDCNIQQVKPKCFEVIIYGVVFDDAIYLFKTNSNTIVSDKNIGYVDKQHRGNIGEGQFHIKRKNLQYHIDNFLYKKISWEDVVMLLESSK